MNRLLKAIAMHIPIVRLLLSHHDERCEAEALKQRLLEQQHEIARRVHVIEWQTFPHTRRDERPHG